MCIARHTHGCTAIELARRAVARDVPENAPPEFSSGLRGGVFALEYGDHTDGESIGVVAFLVAPPLFRQLSVPLSLRRRHRFDRHKLAHGIVTAGRLIRILRRSINEHDRRSSTH
jgi:hypothetical protein